MTYPDSGTVSDEFPREFWRFGSYYLARRFWGEKVREEPGEPEDLAAGIGSWDEEVSWLYEP
jgi:hypothetical protein